MAASRAKAPLRAVKADEKPATAPSKRMSVSEAAEVGGRELLVAMRTRIATTVQDPNCPARDLAALTRRLQELEKEIRALDIAAKQEADEDASGTEDEAWDAEAL